MSLPANVWQSHREEADTLECVRRDAKQLRHISGELPKRENHLLQGPVMSRVIDRGPGGELHSRVLCEYGVWQFGDGAV